MAPPPIRLENGDEKYDIDLMCKAIEKYIDEHKKSVPILKECCLLNDWDYDYFMRIQRKSDTLRQSVKRLLDWKEIRLEQGALSGQLDKTMAIFSLKQPAHGWTDKPKNDDDADIVARLIDGLSKINQLTANPVQNRSIEDVEKNE